MKTSSFSGNGDFDQLSLSGVDFGQDYTKDWGIEPTNLDEGMDSMEYIEESYDDAQQLGGSADFGMSAFGAFKSDMGIIPANMGYDPQQLGYNAQQLGILPSGLGGGFVPATMGSLTTTLATPLFKVGTFQVTYLHAALAIGAGVAAWKMGYLKKLGLNF